MSYDQNAADLLRENTELRDKVRELEAKVSDIEWADTRVAELLAAEQAKVRELEAELEQRVATAEDFLRELEEARLEAFRRKRELEDCRVEWRKQERGMVERSEQQGAEIARLRALAADSSARVQALEAALKRVPVVKPGDPGRPDFLTCLGCGEFGSNDCKPDCWVLELQRVDALTLPARRPAPPAGQAKEED